MATRSDADKTPEATEMQRAQARRLRRLREHLSESQIAAAGEAGVSKDAWNRMETGEHKISPLALARYGAAHDIAVEYVISGRLVGLPEPLMRVIAAVEAREEALRGSSPVGTAAPSRPTTAGKSAEKSTPGKGKRSKAPA
ncbi:MAG: helix-turn-helix domain-containing protein [Betaproteobacteria bacterium]|nr:helix-turn-helix domain-containing protein [Betaproteobacteria bacterium]